MTLGLLRGQLVDCHLEEILSRFRGEYSNVSIEIHRDTYQALMKGLKTGEIDFVYMPEWQYGDPSGLNIRRVSSMETLLVIPRRLMAQAEDRVFSLTEFKDYPFITMTDEESRTSKQMMKDLFSELGIDPEVLEAGSIQEQIGKVEMGEGIILINPNNSICFSPNVHCIRVKELEPQPFAIAWRNKDATESVTLFSRFLQQNDNNHKRIP